MASATFTALDSALMRDALALATSAVGLTDPNPRVGCVLAGSAGQRAEGHTQAAGEAHAEVMALRAAAAAGWDPRGATAYVTLEPCAHHGRTPPCCDALAAADVARVVVAVRDPNPLVAGQGIDRLRAAGIVVDEGLMADEARELNIGFFSRMVRGRPWVRMKIAASLDGRTALADGSSQWITAEAARTDGHAWRRRSGAVLTGVGTVREDDPRLDVRLVSTARQPLRVIVDSRLETPLDARILPAPGKVLLYAAAPDAARIEAFDRLGAEVALRPGAHAKVDLAALLADLGQRGINELHVEAGTLLNGSLLREGLVDELLVYLAPKLLGPGRDMASLGPLARLSDALDWRFTSVTLVGGDLRILARKSGPSTFLAHFRKPPDMFTGIISGLGRIVEAASLGDDPSHGKRLTLETPPGYLDDVQAGDSIAMNGACMTVTTFDAAARRFSIDISAESLRLTAGLGEPGPVNLEKALRAHDRLGGHMVSGHVDGLGLVTHFAPVGESWELRVQAPRDLGRFLAYKGSITVNGVSLTVNSVRDVAEGCEFSINLIPHTIDNTTLGHLKAGSSVNLEIDLIARYVARMMEVGGLK